jgi:hypothetical protein
MLNVRRLRRKPVRALLGGNFADIDTNHDGWIDRKEAEAYLARRRAYTP